MILGSLPYLNVKPLVYLFENGHLPDGWKIVYAEPSKLAEMLAEGSVDVAPVSSFACFQNPDLWTCPDICIASRGAVTTVIMLSKKPVKEIEQVALDASSLSGAALLKIVLAENYGLHPQFVPADPDPHAMLAKCDACLVIGNPAMRFDKTGLHILDLGEEWLQLTGLPTVFAVWAGPRRALTSDVIAHLRSSRDKGCGALEKIAEHESRSLGLPADMCLDYLKKIMVYTLGDREIASLQAFGKKACEHGLIPAEPEIRIAEPQ
jgi:chorismate dehydratase